VLPPFGVELRLDAAQVLASAGIAVRPGLAGLDGPDPAERNSVVAVGRRGTAEVTGDHGQTIVPGAPARGLRALVNSRSLLRADRLALLGHLFAAADEPSRSAYLRGLTTFARPREARDHMGASQFFIHEIHRLAPVRVFGLADRHVVSLVLGR
jgi:hypothetical protein